MKQSEMTAFIKTLNKISNYLLKLEEIRCIIEP